MTRSGFTLCWAAKGGSGTTVVAAALALHGERPALLIDLAGDLPAVLGMSEPTGPGIHDWIVADAPPQRIDDLTVRVAPGLELVAAGPQRAGHGDPRWAELGAWLAAGHRHVVVDAGTGVPPRGLHDHAVQSLLVTRACYVALRRAVALPYRPSGVVLIVEPTRTLKKIDVETAVGAPVVATLDHDPAVFRAVDAGLLASRFPRVVPRRLRGVA